MPAQNEKKVWIVYILIFFGLAVAGVSFGVVYASHYQAMMILKSELKDHETKLKACDYELSMVDKQLDTAKAQKKTCLQIIATCGNCSAATTASFTEHLPLDQEIVRPSEHSNYKFYHERSSSQIKTNDFILIIVLSSITIKLLRQFY